MWACTGACASKAGGDGCAGTSTSWSSGSVRVPARRSWACWLLELQKQKKAFLLFVCPVKGLLLRRAGRPHPLVHRGVGAGAGVHVGPLCGKGRGTGRSTSSSSGGVQVPARSGQRTCVYARVARPPHVCVPAHARPQPPISASIPTHQRIPPHSRVHSHPSVNPSPPIGEFKPTHQHIHTHPSVSAVISLLTLASADISLC